MFTHNFGNTLPNIIIIIIAIGFVSISSAQKNNGCKSNVVNALQELEKEVARQHEQVQRQLATLNQSVQDLSLKLDQMSQSSKTSPVKTEETVGKGPKKLHYDFNVSYIDGAPDGVRARKVLATNGQFPGPMIIGNLGDEVTVRVTNNNNNNGENKSDPITLHWHGLFQNGSQFEDGAEGVTQCGIPPGKTQTYSFKLEQTGTFWWHSHVVHQYTEGLFGPLIVLNPNDPSDPYINRYDPGDEIVLLLSDWNHKPGAEISKWYLSHDSEGNEPIPDSILINGRGSYPCKHVQNQTEAQQTNHSLTQTCDPDLQTAWRFWVTRDKTYRIRVISAAGFSSFNFSIDGHKLEVIETDGNLVREKSGQSSQIQGSGNEQARIHGPLVDIISISPGQRFSVLVTMNSSLNEAEGREPNFAIHSVALTNYFPDEGPDIRSNPGVLQSEIHSILQYESSDVVQNQLRGKFQFQYFQNLDEDSSKSSPIENPAISNTSAFTNIPAPSLTKNISPVLLDDSTLSGVEGPAPTTSSSSSSEIIEIPLNIEKMEEDHLKKQGFYLTFNNISYSYNYKNTHNQNPNQSHNEINTPLLVRVLNRQPLPPSAHPIYLPQLGQIVQIIVNNHDDGPHPLHIHGHKFWVMGKGRENEGDYLKDNKNFSLDSDGVPRDTAFVEGSSWLVLRFISDNPGIWLFHCHMQWHAMGGLKLAFIEAEDELRRQVKEIPSEAKNICSYNGIEL